MNRESNLPPLTYETIENIIDRPLELVNDNFHESRDFLELYYAFNKKFPQAESKRSEYLKWHKNFGKEIFDNNKFEKSKSVKDKLTFLKVHPLLTMKDNKNLSLIRANLVNHQRKMFLLEFFGGICIFLGYVRYRYGVGKTREYFIKNRVRLFFLTVINVFLFDILYSLTMKNRYIEKIIEEKGMKKKYFDDYLI
jgi:hypothetical protein